MADYVPIDQVPKTYDPTKIVYLTNPLDEAFEHTHDGRPVKVKAGETVPMTEPVARLLAHHMATKEMLAPRIAAEREARGKPFSERSWEHVNELSNGVDPAEIDKRAKELIKDKPPKVKATA